MYNYTLDAIEEVLSKFKETWLLCFHAIGLLIV